MMRQVFCMLAGLIFLGSAVAGDAIKIAAKTNIGPVQYLFTADAASPSNNGGLAFELAIRRVPRELILNLARAAKNTSGFESYIVNKLGMGDDGYMELVGFVIAGELYYLSDDTPVASEFKSRLAGSAVSINGNVVSVMK